MSRVSHLPKNIPSKDVPFKVKVKGSVSKKNYEGEFVVRVPSVREMGKIGIELARLNDGIPLEMLDKSTANLHNAIAFLRACIKEGPAWFLNRPEDETEEGMDYGLDTLDINVPVEIFSAADKAVKKWYDSLKGQPEEKPQDEPRS